MEFDPYLYVALAAGWALGRLFRLPEAWVRRGTFVTVVVLVALLGATLRGVGLAALAVEIPWAVGFVALLLGVTVAVFWLLARASPAPARPPGPEAPRTWSTSLALVAALLAGFGLGGVVALPTAVGLRGTLYALLFLVGIAIHLDRAGLARAWLPITAAGVGAVAGSLLFYLAGHTALGPSLGIGLAFGWYTLAGPLLSAHSGAAIGLLAFLVNFLREILTMLLSPRLGPRLGGPGLAAMGGATAMDTTLPFVTRYGSEESASLALASGLVLTVVAGLVVPLVLAAL